MTVMATPDRSLAQRLDALERANVVRSKRAALKRDLKAGRVSPVNVLAAPPWWAETMKAVDLFEATPKYGRVKAVRALGEARVSLAKTLGGMTDRQRQALALILEGRRAGRQVNVLADPFTRQVLATLGGRSCPVESSTVHALLPPCSRSVVTHTLLRLERHGFAERVEPEFSSRPLLWQATNRKAA